MRAEVRPRLARRSAENGCRSCASGASGPAWPSPGAERPHHAGEKEIWLTHYHGTVRIAIYQSRLRPAAIGPRQQRRSAMPFCGRSSSSPRSRLLIGQADVLETPRPASRTFLLLQSVGRLFRPLPFQTGGSPRRAARSDCPIPPQPNRELGMGRLVRVCAVECLGGCRNRLDRISLTVAVDPGPDALSVHTMQRVDILATLISDAG